MKYKKGIKDYVNPNGISITYSTKFATMYYYYGDDVELNYDFKSIKEIEKVFGKDLDDIDSTDLMHYQPL